MNDLQNSNKNEKGREEPSAKHMSTQTRASDISGRSNSIKNAFLKQKLKSMKTKHEAAMKSIVKPIYESTPLRNYKIQNHYDSNSDCEVLIENVTPIKIRTIHSRSLQTDSNSPYEIPNRMSKSDNAPRTYRSLTTRQMLSLDETFLKSVDFESIEGKKAEDEQEHHKTVGSSSNKTVTSHLVNTTELNEASKDNVHSSIPNISTSVSKSKASKPSKTGKIKSTTKASETTANCITVTADIHSEELKNINVDHWVDDSFAGHFKEHFLTKNSESNESLSCLLFNQRDLDEVSDRCINSDASSTASKRKELCMPPPNKTHKDKCPKPCTNSRICTPEIQPDELNHINIDNWVDDSFSEHVLCESRYHKRKPTAINNRSSKRHVTRPKSPVINKKPRNDINVLDNESRVHTNKETTAMKHKNSTVQNLSNIDSSKCSLSVSQKEIKEIDKVVAAIEESIDNNCNSPFQNIQQLQDPPKGLFSEKLNTKLVRNVHEIIRKPQTIVDVVSSAESENKPRFIELGPFFGLPAKVKNLLEKYKGISSLYEWQKECLNLQALRDRRNLVYALPTSGGKTLVAEILLLRELFCCKKNALFILPYVAIVQEKVHSLSPFAIDLQFLVEEYAAGKGQYPPKKRRYKQSVYVATIEKAHSLINSFIETKRLSEIGLVVVDELHLLGEGGRGATLECLLTKILFLGGNIHIVGMSATIGNLNEVAQFLNAEIYQNNFRPVELKEYVKCEDTLWSVNYGEDDLLTMERKVDPPYTSSMKAIDPDKVCSLALEVVPEYSCLIFCQSKKNCENVASLLTKIMPRDILDFKKKERLALCRALLSEGGGSGCEILQSCIPFGVAYHHSGLTGDERRLLEDAYRAGTLCVICCTSTLAAGVNLPAKRVILRAPYVGRSFIGFSQYKQMIGRAGRAGFDDIGESILVCQANDMHKVTALLRSDMENANSKMHESESRGLQSLVLGSVGLGIANSRRDLYKIVAHTLLTVQCAKLQETPNRLVDKSISKLFKLGIMKIDTKMSESNSREEKNISIAKEPSNHSLNITYPAERQSPAENGSKGKKHLKLGLSTPLKISKLGKAAMKGPIDLCHANNLYKDLIQAQSSMVLSSYLHLLYLVTPYDMMDQIKVDSEKYFIAYSNLGLKDQQTPIVIGINQACMVNIVRGSKSYSAPERIVHRFYITLILYDLWNHCTVWEVAKKYNLPRGLIQNLMTSAASFASCVLHFCEELDEFWAFKEILNGFAQRLSHCCSADLVQLMELPAVKLGRARQLFNAGFKTLTDVANANASTLTTTIDHLPRKTANQIIAAAKLLLLAKAENLREEAEDVLEGLSVNNTVLEN